MARSPRLLFALLIVAGCGESGGGIVDTSIDTGWDLEESGDAPSDVLPDGCTPEECNYADDDCDTIADNGFDLLADVSNCGACGFACSNAHAVPMCVDGLCMIDTCEDGYHDVNGNPYDGCEYACTATTFAESPADSTCDDGEDNDCDGRVDLDDPDCSDCVPEFCNGLDDDCDTLTDEDFDLRSDPLNCGSCFHICPARPHAAPLCVLGACDIECEAGWEDLDGNDSNGCESPCVPGTDTSEFDCNGRDGDCDGSVDEDYIPYSCGAGACVADSVCTGGAEVCEPLDPLADDDRLCDGIDNDCDGSVDEEYVPVFCYGVCAPTARCVGGAEVCGPTDEDVDVTCDGLDGDCDGSADEDYAPYTCGSGVCTTTSICSAGSESCTPGGPTGPDTDCDAVDEDCDGSADEHYVSHTCGTGACTRTSTCSGGTESCTPGSPTGGDTDCDRIDDDCDGTSDEHYVSTYTCGIGACRWGSICTGGVESCTPGPPTGSDTDCDAVDDDCDGLVDEHYVSTTWCGTGACRRSSTCSGGTVSCTPGSPTGGDTDCDAIDDDCDGATDEHYSPTYTCGIGACLRSSVCSAGTESCTPGSPSGETCNGLDDNCNGTPDDGTGTALCGAIPHGLPACVGGTCTISSCDAGWYNVDGIFSTGCECQEDSYEASGGDTCGAAVSLGPLTDSPGSNITVTGNIAPTGDSDWYSVTASDDPDTTGDEFEFEVYFQTNPGGALRFDVYRGGCGTLLCSSVNDCANWYTDFRGLVGGETRGESPCRASPPGPGFNECTGNGTTYYIRVFRPTGSATCSSYTLRISNNSPSGAVSCSHL